MDELTPFQVAILERIEVAMALGIIAAAITVGLLAMVAIRSVWSD